MISFLLATSVVISPMWDETINRYCARVVGIPYASDNFTDSEWQQFELCRNIMYDHLEQNGGDV
jgi:hypothetical protein